MATSNKSRYLMPLLRFLGGCCGAATVALGVWSIVQDAENIGVIVNNVYRCIFGLLIIAAEFRATSLLRWFSFLTFFWGLAAFYIFVGGLAMGGEWYEIALAVGMVAIGIIYLGSACACSEYAQQEQARNAEKVAAKEANEAARTPLDKASADASGSPASPYREMEDGTSRREKLVPDSPFGDSDGSGYGRGSVSQGNKSQAARGAYGQSSGDIDPFAGHQGRTSAYD